MAKSRVLAVVVCVIGVLALGAGAAFAGEVTGSGKNDQQTGTSRSGSDRSNDGEPAHTRGYPLAGTKSFFGRQREAADTG